MIENGAKPFEHPVVIETGPELGRVHAPVAGVPVDQAEIPGGHRVEQPVPPEAAEHGRVPAEGRKVRQDGLQGDDVFALVVGLGDGAFERLFEVGDDIARVASENLIAPLSVQHDLDPPGGLPGDDVLREETRSAGRLVHVVDELGEGVDEILHLGVDFPGFRSGQADDFPGVGRFVEGGAFPERPGEADEGLGGLPGGQQGHEAGVEASAEGRPDRHVAPKLKADGVLEKPAQPVEEIFLGMVGVDGEIEIPKGFLPDVPGFRVDQQIAAGRDFPDVLEERVSAENVLKDGVIPDRFLVDGRGDAGMGQEGLDFRGEKPGAAGIVDIEGLESEMIPGGHQPAEAAVVKDESEHAVEMLDAIGAEFEVGVKENLGIRGGRERPAEAAELFAEFQVIVDDPVEDNRDVLNGHGLAAGLEIDDGQPLVGEPEGAFDELALLVRSAVGDPFGHPAENRGIGGLLVLIEKCDQSAHG